EPVGGQGARLPAGGGKGKGLPGLRAYSGGLFESVEGPVAGLDEVPPEMDQSAAHTEEVGMDDSPQEGGPGLSVAEGFQRGPPGGGGSLKDADNPFVVKTGEVVDAKSPFRRGVVEKGVPGGAPRGGILKALSGAGVGRQHLEGVPGGKRGVEFRVQ